MTYANQNVTTTPQILPYPVNYSQCCDGNSGWYFDPYLCEMHSKNHDIHIEPEYELVELDYGYISDEIDISAWTKYRANIVEAPTGTGKTTFITNNLIKEARRLGKTVLIVSNRIATDLDLKHNRAYARDLYPDVSDKELRYIWDFGDVTILKYHNLSWYMYDCKSNPDYVVPGYVVFDEAHYFTSDATFSAKNGKLLNNIPKFFQNSIRVYMSATMYDVLGYICIEEIKCRRLINFAEHYPGYMPGEFKYNYDAYNKYLEYGQRPILYKMEPDFSHINLKFITRDSEIEDIIRNSNGKSLVFVDNSKYGKQLQKNVAGAIFLDREIKDKNPESFNKIIKNKKFDSKVLITTKILDNGIDLIDCEIEDIIVRSSLPTDIVQMVGRYRKESKDKPINVYIKIPEKSQLSSYIREIDMILADIKLSKKDPREFMCKLANDKQMYERVHNIVEPNAQLKYTFDWLTEAMLKKNRRFYAHLMNVLNTEGVEGCCKIYANLFNKEYSPEMWVDYVEFCAWLDNWVDKPLKYDKFEKFCKEFRKEFLRVFKGKKGRDKWGIEACNNHLENKKLPYRIYDEKGRYILRRVQNA